MKREPGMAYNTKTLNKVFAVVSIIFLITVIWLVLDDFIRPWKKIQVENIKIKKEILDAQIAKKNEQIDMTKVQSVIKEIDNGQKEVKKYAQDIFEINNKIADLKGRLYAQKMIDGRFNADFTETAFKYGVAEAHHSKDAKSLRAKLEKLRSDFADSKDKIKTYEIKIKSLQDKLAEYTRTKDKAEKKLDELVGSRDRLEAAADKLDILSDPKSLMVWLTRNAPMLNFLDPTIKIEQIVLDNYVDDRYFRVTEKVDRCITCHQNIDQPGFENQKQPFATHPRLDMMVGKMSNHPIKKFGCTMCHGGEGHRVNDFNSPAHIPQNEEQKKEWIAKYHWHAPHKVPNEIQRLQYTESQCLKCHQGVEYVKGATVLNEGKDLVEKFGCYGCHKIKGFEHKVKPGPSLHKVASKTTKEWVKNWVWNPHLFNPKSNMPSFFNQSNNNKPKFVKKNVTEVNAIAEYLYEESRDYTPTWKYAGGNADKGKELVQTIGCLGCHTADGIDEEFTKAKNQRAPHLASLGSKVDPDWLVSWLIKPSHYQEDTIMPSFRLTKREANDIAAFLLKSRNKKFDQLKFEGIDDMLMEDILMDYFTAFDNRANASKKLAGMSHRAKVLELGKRSINKYGCATCHDINGFEEAVPIGPELNGIGTKPVTQLGFGHEKVEHRRDSWIYAHLKNPRRWDHGAAKPFKDLLRMPQFYMSDNEAEKITTFLLGLVNEKIPMRGLYNLSAAEQIVAEGEKVVDKYNCMGCHNIDGMGGEILKNYEDQAEAPPMLMGHGERVHADWLNNFFKNVHPMRTYLSLRMPSFNFSEKERNSLVEYFRFKSGTDVFVDRPAKVSWEPGEKAAAKKLWDNLACISCHSQGFSNDDPSAPDLKLAKRKLRSEWIEKWLRDPQAIIPGVAMPSFWADGESPEPDILGGDSDKQIRALRKLIQDFGDDEFKKPYSYLK